MTKYKSDIPKILQVPFHRLEVIEDGISITKNMAMLNVRILVTLIGVILITFILWNLLKQSPNAFKKPISFIGLVTLLLAIIFIVITSFLKFKRFKRLISNFIIQKKNDLLINNCPVLIAKNEKILVVIQNVGADGGVGGSFTVGILAGNKFLGLCYDLDEVFAKKVATFMSYYLEYDIEIREEASAFPLLRGH